MKFKFSLLSCGFILASALPVVPAEDETAPHELKADARTLALWKMTYEGEGKIVKDLGDHAHDLVPMAGDKAPRATQGRFGSALLFDAETLGLKLADSKSQELMGEKGITIQAWVRPGKPAQELSMIAECCEYKKTGWRLAISKDGTIYFILETPGEEVSVNAKAGVCDGEWHLVEASHDVASGQAIIRFDGHVVGQKILETVPPISPIRGNFAVGTGGGPPPNGWYYEGGIASLKISEGATF